MGRFTDWLFPASQDIATWDRGDSKLTELTVKDLYGLDVSGICDLSRDDAMKIASVAKVRNRVCAKIGGFPMVSMQGVSTAKNQPAWVTCLEPGRARFITVSWITESLMFFGRAWLIVEQRYAQTGKPMSYKFVPEWKATVVNGRLVKAWGEDVDPSQVIMIEAHHEGLLNYGQDVLKRAAVIEHAAARAAENPVPSIELHQTGGHTMSDLEIDTLIARWAKARNGKNGGVAFTNQSIETKTHGQAAEQLLIDGRNAASIDVARAMGAPAWSVDASVSGSSLTYGNVNARSRELVEDTLQPYMECIAGRLSLDDVLAAGTWLKIDATDVLREDFSARMSGYKAAIEAEIYTKEECRAIERGIPLESSEVAQ